MSIKKFLSKIYWDFVNNSQSKLAKKIRDKHFQKGIDEIARKLGVTSPSKPVDSGVVIIDDHPGRMA